MNMNGNFLLHNVSAWKRILESIQAFTILLILIHVALGVLSKQFSERELKG